MECHKSGLPIDFSKTQIILFECPIFFPPLKQMPDVPSLRNLENVTRTLRWQEH
jgi:hypothetical protein